jgi:hypothetical protein
LAAKRRRMVNRISSDPANRLHEWQEAGDFKTDTQDKVKAPA